MALEIGERGPRHARSVFDGVRSGDSKKPCAFLDQLILNVGILGNLRAATPLYQMCEGLFVAVVKRGIALPCTTWCDVEETISSLSDHLVHAHALESIISTSIRPGRNICYTFDPTENTGRTTHTSLFVCPPTINRR